MDCIFCKIAKQEIPAKIYYRDVRVVVFDDLHPQAPIHKLIIPVKHITTLNDLNEEDHELIGYLLTTATKVAQTEGFAEQGYRLVSNCNTDGGQTVSHLHIHLLGGRAMHWPPG